MFLQAQQLLYFQPVPSFYWPGKATVGTQTLKEAQSENSLLGYLGSVMVKLQHVSRNDPTELSSSFHDSSGSQNNDPEETWRKPAPPTTKIPHPCSETSPGVGSSLLPLVWCFFGEHPEAAGEIPPAERARSWKRGRWDHGKEEDVTLEKEMWLWKRGSRDSGRDEDVILEKKK